MKSNNLSSYKEIRLKNYDYSQSGYYYVTICTDNKKCILCKITPSNLELGYSEPIKTSTEVGKIVDRYINNIATVYNNVNLDCYILMPNHIHLIVVIATDKNSLNATNTSLPQIVNSLKTISSKKAGFPIWQKNYYEHIIRCEEELNETRKYIQNNPLKWCDDDYYINH